MQHRVILSDMVDSMIFEAHCNEVIEFAESLTQEEARTLLYNLSDAEIDEIVQLAEEIPAYKFFLGRLLSGAGKAVASGWAKGAAGGKGFFGGLGGALKGLKGFGGAVAKVYGKQKGSGFLEKMGNFNKALTRKPKLLTGKNFKPAMGSAGMTPALSLAEAYLANK